MVFREKVDVIGNKGIINSRCRENCAGRKKWAHDIVVRADCLDLCKTEYGNAVFVWSLRQLSDVSRIILIPEDIPLKNKTYGGKFASVIFAFSIYTNEKQILLSFYFDYKSMPDIYP